MYSEIKTCESIFINKLLKYVLLNTHISMNLKHISPVSWIHNRIFLKTSILFNKSGNEDAQEHSGVKLII